MNADSPNPKHHPPRTPEALERQRAGQYKGLLRAVKKHKADNSADYAPSFDHGQLALDFERSAPAAGETRKQVRAHETLFDRTLLTLCGFLARVAAAALPKLPLHTDDHSPRAPKLVRALALLAWRPLRLFRTQELWEWLALCYHLEELKSWRQKHGALTVERFEEFRDWAQAILHNSNWGIDGRLKRIEKRFWRVWRLYRGLVGAVLGSRDSGFGVRAKRLGVGDWGLGNRNTGFGGRGTWLRTRDWGLAGAGRG